LGIRFCEYRDFLLDRIYPSAARCRRRFVAPGWPLATYVNLWQWSQIAMTLRAVNPFRQRYMSGAPAEGIICIRQPSIAPMHLVNCVEALEGESKINPRRISSSSSP